MDRDAHDEFIGKLRRWKHEGCSVLVVGEPLCLLQQTSKLLLGDDEETRHRIFVLTNAETESVYDRLSTTPKSRLGMQTKILDYESMPRSATPDEPLRPDTIPVLPVHGDLDRLYDELTDAMELFESRYDTLPPSAIRLSVDTLAPILEEYDRDAIGHWLTHVRTTLKNYRAMGHHLLPKPYDSAVVSDLADHFDAIIEVRARDASDAERKERWHVPEHGLTTPWRIMDDDV